jgi:hypothetical protein
LNRSRLTLVLDQNKPHDHRKLEGEKQIRFDFDLCTKESPVQKGSGLITRKEGYVVRRKEGGGEEQTEQLRTGAWKSKESTVRGITRKRKRNFKEGIGREGTAPNRVENTISGQ